MFEAPPLECPTAIAQWMLNPGTLLAFINARRFCRCRRGAPLALGAAGGARAYLVGGPRHAGSPRGLRMGVRAILSALRVGGRADSLSMAWLHEDTKFVVFGLCSSETLVR